jgi:hypothetical protein
MGNPGRFHVTHCPRKEYWQARLRRSNRFIAITGGECTFAIMHDHTARLRSYELIAEAFELTGQPQRRSPASLSVAI